MTTLPIKMIIESVIQRLSENGKNLYVLHSGDNSRGILYIKTYAQSTNLFITHSRQYDFNSDSYVWNQSEALREVEIDTMLKKYSQDDQDCWCIDVEDSVNPFAGIF